MGSIPTCPLLNNKIIKTIMADYKNTIDFIKSVYGNKEFTPLAVPVFAGNEKKYLNECIDTTFVSSVGKFVDRFE